MVMRLYGFKTSLCPSQGGVIVIMALLTFFATLCFADDWGKIRYEGQPWTQNISEPFDIEHGLQGHHLSLWASHGMYYDKNKSKWQWQRPSLFLTREDLFTQTFVVPYLIPMLENAGAIVFTPRERDWQKNEVIVDNDQPTQDNVVHYIETSSGEKWQMADTCGFAFHAGNYYDKENPFRSGTARKIRTTSKKKVSTASYIPLIPERGKYAVYVSYQTVDGSVDRAQYSVYHQGVRTDFIVNQQMGGGTWVYLGTFDFDEGCDEQNCVVLTNYCKDKGYITTDAVRFGGGMGNISRGGSTSGMPRSLEGARYFAQWSGMDYDVYSSKNGNDDYGDDINARSLMTNYLAGGSVYMPTVKGVNVPIELSLAVHSDAGYHQNGTDIYGTLGICTTTKEGNLLYSSGLSRSMGYEFAQSLLENVNRDITAKYGTWATRSIRDKNYSESRVPEVPCAIIETLSHQNFPDMKMAHDPNFKFTLARAIYKTILRFVTGKHNEKYIVAPLAPTHFRVDIDKKGNAELEWEERKDELEKSADADGYILYIKEGNCGWDNGQYVKSKSFYISLKPNIQYDFKVVAVNDGGKSFPSETISAYYYPQNKKKVLVVNGFHRLSAPAQIDNETSQGFNINEDPGVWEGINPGWCGRQLSFDKLNMGSESSSGLGYSASNLIGKFLVGNEFDYISTHTNAITRCKKATVCSASSDALEDNLMDLGKFEVIDLILGNEKDDGHSLVKYKTFSPKLQQALRAYTSVGGSLMVSGSYVASDMRSVSDSTFLANVLKLNYAGRATSETNGLLSGMNVQFNIYNSLNENHYAATSTDCIAPIEPSFSAIKYDNDSTSACVAYKGNDYRCITMSFPFECITNPNIRVSLMQGILDFLIK